MKRGTYTWMVLVLIAFTAASLKVSAQDHDVVQDGLVNGHLHKVNEVLYSNLTFIKQTGDENQVKAIQEQRGLHSNVVEVEQLDRGNTAYIEQSGSGHGTWLMQKGTANEANIWSEGNSTISKASQTGDGNRINSYLNNNSSLPKGAILIQEGNNNSIDFALTGSNDFDERAITQTASIRQTGNDLQVNAVFESLDSPIQIDQQSGPAGGGMKVDVSTSDFYFPMKR